MTDGLRSKFASWAFQQGVSTVLLLIQTLLLAWFGYYAITEAIPAHLAAIQTGYDRQEKAHSDNIKQFFTMVDRQREQLEREREMYRESLIKTVREAIKEALKDSHQ